MNKLIKSDEADNLDRLFKDLKSSTGMSRAAFARQFNVPGGAQMIQQHLKGVRPINMDAGIAYANGFKVSLEEVSPRLAKEAAKAMSAVDTRLNTEPGPEITGRVPLISWIMAGNWNGMTHDKLQDETDTWISCPTAHSNRTFALRVRGDSMASPFGRTYPEGSIIFVDPEQNQPANGDRILALLAGETEATFKVYVKEGSKVWLKPLNPQHPIITEDFKILGRVIGTWMEE
jgi:SOS-response transcriptional repressor LexA